MTMTPHARQLLLWHIIELEGLLDRLLPGGIAHAVVTDRLAEAKSNFDA
jgi:hypothetical protein